MPYMGRMIVSVKGTELLPSEMDIIAHTMTAGIILFTKNFANSKQLHNLIGSIQYFAIKAGKAAGIPIFVDQEGGRVQRFRGDFATSLPQLESFGKIYDEQGKEAGLKAAMASGQLMALPLMNIGVLSLAPVLDIMAGNKVIEGLGRALHKEPQICAELAIAYIDGMNTVGMPATGKHFPGHGQNIGDSHEIGPIDDRTLEVIESQDLIPFTKLIQQRKLAAIMPAHITYPKVDPNNTAGMSKIWLETLLRKRYDFDGIIVSDCLSMKGAGDGEYLEKTKKALEYGDIALLCNLEPMVLLAVINGLDTQKYCMTAEIKRRYSNWVDSTREARLHMANAFAKSEALLSQELRFSSKPTLDNTNDEQQSLSTVDDGMQSEKSNAQLTGSNTVL